MALEDKVQDIRDSLIKSGKESVPRLFQGISKQRIREVLSEIDRASNDLVDTVFALLDDQQPSWFSKAGPGMRFCDGASTAHIACHVGILQRGERKLDREGRDYWIKPLRDVGAIEAVTLNSKIGSFIAGHPVAKSSNSAYRLADDFVKILRTDRKERSRILRAWISEDSVRRRLMIQAKLAKQAKRAVDTKHSDLIATACKYYVPKFLPGFEILYIDDGDGDRISEESRKLLESAGLEILLEDAMPDVLLWNPKERSFWIIEAVTSDGEVDLHKVQQINRMINRSRKNSRVGFTTVYRTWKNTASRQARYKNLAPDTFLWIQEDASKQFHVLSFE